MSEKPEALRLADDLETVIRQEDAEDNVILVPRWTAEDSVAELRRLHAEIKRLKAERDEAVKAEREACAKVCEEYDTARQDNYACLCANAIRKRGGMSHD